MSKNDIQTAMALKLNESVREFLSMLHFHAIPAEAKYLAVYPDGQMQFFEELHPTTAGIVAAPKVLTYVLYENVILSEE